MNYSELTQQIQDYLQTTETSFVTNIPTFVKLAEERINREVMIPDLRRTATGTFTASDRYLQKPSDYLATFDITYEDAAGDEFHLILKDQSFMREAYPSASTSGAPKYYAHFDSDFWVVAPTPDDNYQVDITYYYDPESIVTASTSWLGDNAESALLYGCLVEAYTYLKGDPDLTQLYMGMYRTSLDQLIDLGMLRSKRDEYRDGEIRRRA